MSKTEKDHPWSMLWAEEKQLAQGALKIGSKSTIHPGLVVPISADHFSVTVDPTSTQPMQVSVFLADVSQTKMHGIPRHWVHIKSGDKLLRMNPMTQTLELSMLADASTRFLATLVDLGYNVKTLELHGTALGIHQSARPLHSANALVTTHDGTIRILPTGGSDQTLYIIE